MAQKKDVFLCHASEDKTEIVRPIAKALEQAGITYWFDEAEIIWGDSIIGKIQDGLSMSRFVIVILSESFLSKQYPLHELNSALNIEASTGEIRVLPLIVGTEKIKKKFLVKYPILGTKKYESWDRDTQKIIQSLKTRLSGEKVLPPKQYEPDEKSTYDIPMPKIQRKFTQREKDIFTKDSFPQIIAFFKNALKKLENSYSEANTDLTEIHNFKFICTIYVNGEVKNKCKIWLGGMMSSESISYQEGSNVSIEHDNSYNDWLTITDDGSELGFEIGNKYAVGMGEIKESALNPQKAAEYLWKRFTACF
jgi:hypothetical protein